MEKVVLSNLAYLRRAANLTQRGLAEKLGVTRLCVFGWEKGYSCPEFRVVTLISEALNCKLDDLIQPFKPNGEWTEKYNDLFLRIETTNGKSETTGCSYLLAMEDINSTILCLRNEKKNRADKNCCVQFLLEYLREALESIEANIADGKVILTLTFPRTEGIHNFR